MANLICCMAAGCEYWTREEARKLNENSSWSPYTTQSRTEITTFDRLFLAYNGTVPGYWTIKKIVKDHPVNNIKREIHLDKWYYIKIAASNQELVHRSFQGIISFKMDVTMEDLSIEEP